MFMWYTLKVSYKILTTFSCWQNIRYVSFNDTISDLLFVISSFAVEETLDLPIYYYIQAQKIITSIILIIFYFILAKNTEP